MCCTFCIFSNKFDLKQTIRVLHTGGQADIGLNNLLAIGHSKSYQNISSTDLHLCLHLGDTFFCKRRQVMENSITPTDKIPEGGPMRGPQQHFWRSRRESQNLHKNLLIILLARTIQGRQSTRPDLPHLPTTKKVQPQANSATAATDPRTTKLEDSCRFIRAHADG